MSKTITFMQVNYYSVKNLKRFVASLLLGPIFFSYALSQTYYSNFANADTAGHAKYRLPTGLGCLNSFLCNNTYTGATNIVTSSLTDVTSFAQTIAINLGAGNSIYEQADLNLGSNDITKFLVKSGSTAGFVFDNGSLVDADVINSSITISTYLNNVLQESSTSTNLIAATVVGVGISTSTQSVGFPTTKSFNQVGITVTSGVFQVGVFYRINFLYAFASNAVALPVSLTSFTAVSEGKTVKLGWATASESNNNGFVIERSADAVNFSQIGYVASQASYGNSVTTLNYETRDQSPLNGINYYRLKQMDIDGHGSPSIIVSANSSAASSALATFKVFPNPATNLINIQAPIDGNYLVELFTIDGKKVQTSQLSAGGGMLNFNINTMGVKTGIYSLKVTNTNGKSSSFYNTVLIK